MRDERNDLQKEPEGRTAEPARDSGNDNAMKPRGTGIGAFFRGVMADVAQRVIVTLILALLVIGVLAIVFYGQLRQAREMYNQLKEADAMRQIEWDKLLSQKEPEITEAQIYTSLQDASELTTTRLTYVGLISYQEGSIPFLTQKKYHMYYTAHVRAGIDLSQVEVLSLSDGEVVIRLPEVTIQDIVIDPDSIEFVDERSGLFNPTEMTDTVDAIKIAREHVMENADLDSLLEQADQQAERVIRALLAAEIGEREVAFRR